MSRGDSERLRKDFRKKTTGNDQNMKIPNMTTKTKIQVEQNHIKLAPPPAPWAELAVLNTAYLLNDLDSLSSMCIEEYIATHPIIVVKSGRLHIVVGQYRSWRLHQILAKGEVKNEMVHKLNASKKDISKIACTNLFMENLLGALNGKHAIEHIAIIRKKLPTDIVQGILPKVKTDAQFSELLGVSRSAFYGRRKQPSTQSFAQVNRQDTK
jgi:hypothetical protein